MPIIRNVTIVNNGSSGFISEINSASAEEKPKFDKT